MRNTERLLAAVLALVGGVAAGAPPAGFGQTYTLRIGLPGGAVREIVVDYQEDVENWSGRSGLFVAEMWPDGPGQIWVQVYRDGWNMAATWDSVDLAFSEPVRASLAWGGEWGPLSAIHEGAVVGDVRHVSPVGPASLWAVAGWMLAPYVSLVVLLLGVALVAFGYLRR